MCDRTRRDLVTVLAIVCCVLTINMFTVQAKVCEGDYDMRNHPKDLLHMRNCTVIAGSVSIVLMERHRHINFSLYQFPELK